MQHVLRHGASAANRDRPFRRIHPIEGTGTSIILPGTVATEGAVNIEPGTVATESADTARTWLAGGACGRVSRGSTAVDVAGVPTVELEDLAPRAHGARRVPAGQSPLSVPSAL